MLIYFFRRRAWRARYNVSPPGTMWAGPSRRPNSPNDHDYVSPFPALIFPCEGPAVRPPASERTCAQLQQLQHMTQLLCPLFSLGPQPSLRCATAAAPALFRACAASACVQRSVCEFFSLKKLDPSHPAVKPPPPLAPGERHSFQMASSRRGESRGGETKPRPPPNGVGGLAAFGCAFFFLCDKSRPFTPSQPAGRSWRQ